MYAMEQHAQSPSNKRLQQARLSAHLHGEHASVHHRSVPTVTWPAGVPLKRSVGMARFAAETGLVLGTGPWAVLHPWTRPTAPGRKRGARLAPLNGQRATRRGPGDGSGAMIVRERAGRGAAIRPVRGTGP